MTVASRPLAQPRHFAKCLKTMLRYDTTEDGQKCYLLPYTGNLTQSKFEELATKFAEKVAVHYRPNFSQDSVREALLKRLKSEWYTGREKNVRLSQYEFNGNWLCEGEGWFSSNFPDGHFVVVE